MVLGCAMEEAVDLEGISRMATSDTIDERGSSNLIQGRWGIKTWKRVEYARDRIDEMILVDSGKAVEPT